LNNFSSCDALRLLFLEENQLWGVWVLQYALEVHGIVYLIFHGDGFIEGKVVMTFSQCIEVYVSIVPIYAHILFGLHELLGCLLLTCIRHN